LAGDFAFLLFALGILGTGLIGVPVLAGSGAYALSEAMGWRWGLESSVINGIVAVPLMVMIILLSSKRSVMGAYVERG
jgi:Mn2+/Fe2+ NRAMP family transporter